MVKKLVERIKSNHAQANDGRYQRLMERSKSELVEGFIIEMDAKNKAYYFILEYGHLRDFQEYCNKKSSSINISFSAS